MTLAPDTEAELGAAGHAPERPHDAAERLLWALLVSASVVPGRPAEPVAAERHAVA